MRDAKLWYISAAFTHRLQWTQKDEEITEKQTRVLTLIDLWNNNMTTEQSEKVLKFVEANGPVSTLKLAELWQEDHQKIVGIVNSLLSLGEASVFHIFNELLE